MANHETLPFRPLKGSLGFFCGEGLSARRLPDGGRMSQLVLNLELSAPPLSDAELQATSRCALARIETMAAHMRKYEVLKAASIAFWSSEYEFHGVPIWGDRFARLYRAFGDSMNFVWDAEIPEGKAYEERRMRGERIT
jgi:hypothetical protein